MPAGGTSRTHGGLWPVAGFDPSQPRTPGRTWDFRSPDFPHLCVFCSLSNPQLCFISEAVYHCLIFHFAARPFRAWASRWAKGSVQPTSCVVLAALSVGPGPGHPLPTPGTLAFSVMTSGLCSCSPQATLEYYSAFFLKVPSQYLVGELYLIPFPLVVFLSVFVQWVTLSNWLGMWEEGFLCCFDLPCDWPWASH